MHQHNSDSFWKLGPTQQWIQSKWLLMVWQNSSWQNIVDIHVLALIARSSENVASLLCVFMFSLSLLLLCENVFPQCMQGKCFSAPWKSLWYFKLLVRLNNFPQLSHSNLLTSAWIFLMCFFRMLFPETCFFAIGTEIWPLVNVRFPVIC